MATTSNKSQTPLKNSSSSQSSLVNEHEIDGHYSIGGEISSNTNDIEDYDVDAAPSSSRRGASEETAQDEATATDDDLEEPKLTYDRILNDVAVILRTDTITSSCLHNKFFAIGTHSGRIHIFDHLGNKINRQEILVHHEPVNCISIDEKGEYFVSCSNGRSVVYGLCNSEHNDVLHAPPKKSFNVVAIDPNFHRPGSGRRYVVGDDKVALYERGFLARYKSTILQTKEQRVRTISWQGQFITWATDIAVQIFDIEQRAIITRIKHDGDLDPFQDPCQLCWKNKRTLLVGWTDTIKVCVIKERSQEVLDSHQIRELPRKYVEIVSMFETDFVIGGLAPFNQSLLTLSVQNPARELIRPRFKRNSSRPTISEFDTNSLASRTDPSLASSHSDMLDPDVSADQSSGTGQTEQTLVRPQVHILETFPNTYNELSRDILTPSGCLTVASLKNQNLTKSPYTLLSSHRDGIYLVVCPKDVISAKPRDYDDHIDWLIKHSMLKECCDFARKHQRELNRHSIKELEIRYKNELLNSDTQEGYNEAARLSASICGDDLNAWDETIQEFCDVNQLKHLLPFLPKNVDDGFHLKQETYNFILQEFLRNDSISFFRAIKEIPNQLYNISQTTDQVIRSLANDPKNLILNEALAELYTRMGRFEEAVNIYLDYNDKTRIFSLIRNNNLWPILRDRIDRLMQIDPDETSQLLVENIEHISMKVVVNRLNRCRNERYLVAYLHRLVIKDPDFCADYHDLMVYLYANHQRESLLNFLKISTNYRLEDALRICKDANLIKEVVYLHSRMGDVRIALKYITESQGDIREAIEFCKEYQDPELWQDLILYSIDRPEFISALLENIGTHISDPIELIDRIPNGCEIEGLVLSLKKILQDYQLQISLEQNCRDLLAKDCYSLLQKQIRCQTQGIAIKENQMCDHCNQPLLSEVASDNMSQSRTALGTESSGSSGSRSASGALVGTALNSGNDLVVFGCHHVFHEECCIDAEDTSDTALDANGINRNNPPANGGLEAELQPSKILNCRVCMLNSGNQGDGGG